MQRMVLIKKCIDEGFLSGFSVQNNGFEKVRDVLMRLMFSYILFSILYC